MFPDNEEQSFQGIDLLDPTKLVPEELVPVQPVGLMTLDRNPDNHFAQIEQAAFSPGNTVPGHEISPDKMLMTRVFSYPDTHRHRIGANFAELPVNYPHYAENNSYSHDGPMRYTFKAPTQPVYAPNTAGGPVAGQGVKPADEMRWETDGEMVRAAATLRAEDDDFSQPGKLYSEVMDAEEQIVDAARHRDAHVVPEEKVAIALLEAAANGTALNPAQAAMVTSMATSGARLQLGLAPAGSGKTTAMRALAHAWRDGGGRVVGLAPSAVAAIELGASIDAEGDTLAKLT